MNPSLFAFGHPCEYQLKRACIGGHHCPLHGYPDSWCCSNVKGKIHFKRDKPCEGPRCRWGFVHPTQEQFDAVTSILLEARTISAKLEDPADTSALTIDNPHVIDTVLTTLKYLRTSPAQCARRLGFFYAYAAVRAQDAKSFISLLRPMKRPVDPYLLGAWGFLSQMMKQRDASTKAAAAQGKSAPLKKNDEVVDDMRHDILEIMTGALSTGGQLVHRDEQVVLQAVFMQALQIATRNKKKAQELHAMAVERFPHATLTAPPAVVAAAAAAAAAAASSPDKTDPSATASAPAGPSSPGTVAASSDDKPSGSSVPLTPPSLSDAPPLEAVAAAAAGGGHATTTGASGRASKEPKKQQQQQQQSQQHHAAAAANPAPVAVADKVASAPVTPPAAPTGTTTSRDRQGGATGDRLPTVESHHTASVAAATAAVPLPQPPQHHHHHHRDAPAAASSSTVASPPVAQPPAAVAAKGFLRASLATSPPPHNKWGYHPVPRDAAARHPDVPVLGGLFSLSDSMRAKNGIVGPATRFPVALSPVQAPSSAVLGSAASPSQHHPVPPSPLILTPARHGGPPTPLHRSIGPAAAAAVTPMAGAFPTGLFGVGAADTAMDSADAAGAAPTLDEKTMVGVWKAWGM